MIAIAKLTIFCLMLLISTMVLADAELEFESPDLDPNTKVLTTETVKPGSGILGFACCNTQLFKAKPFGPSSSTLQIFFHLPLNSSIRIWLQDQQKYGKVVCGKKSMGCVPIEWVANLEEKLHGVTLKNQCSGKPTNLISPVNAHIGFSVLEGSVTVDGIDEPFTCDDIPKTAEGSKKTKRARRSD